MFRLYTQTHICIQGGKKKNWIFRFLQNLGLTPAAFLWGRNGSTQYKQVDTPRWWGLQFSVCWRICVTRSGSAINRKSLFPQGSSLTRSFWDSLRLRGIFVFSLWKFCFLLFLSNEWHERSRRRRRACALRLCIGSLTQHSEGGKTEMIFQLWALFDSKLFKSGIWVGKDEERLLEPCWNGTWGGPCHF